MPCEFAGQMVSTRLYPGRVAVVAGEIIVASHERLADEGQTQYDWQHYIPLIQRKPGARARRGLFVAQATGRRSPICPGRCSNCAACCCAMPAATA